MVKKNSLFINYSSPDYELRDDFEERVFQKIKVKKRRKKIAVSTIGVFILGAMIFVVGNSFVLKNSREVQFAGYGSSDVNDVMLTDDIELATFDGMNSYIVENVGLTDGKISF